VDRITAPVVLAPSLFASTSAGSTDTITYLSTGIVFKVTSDGQFTTLLTFPYNPNVEN
jgi:hypothetical protein